MSSVLLTLKGIAYAITNPYLVILLFIIGLKFFQHNKKYSFMHQMMLGKKNDSPLELTLSQICLGILCGTIGSIILNLIGVDFKDRSIIYILFFISIFMININPKLICFSYSGPMLGLILVYFNYTNITNFDIKSLVVLISIMHIIESLLVIIDGSRGAIPILNSKEGKVMGGFLLNRSWTVPIAFNNAYPFYSIIGYQSVTFTKSKRQKCFTSGLIIGLYGLLVYSLSLFINETIISQIIVLVLIPILHEGIFLIDNLIEVFKKPIFVNEKEGLRVLEVAHDSQGELIGIESGDVVIKINDSLLETEKGVIEHLQTLQSFVWLKIKKKTGEIKEITYNNFNREIPLGVIFVPRSIKKLEDKTTVENSTGNFRIILEQAKRKKGKDK